MLHSVCVIFRKLTIFESTSIFTYTTLFRSEEGGKVQPSTDGGEDSEHDERSRHDPGRFREIRALLLSGAIRSVKGVQDRKSTRLNSSHLVISYAVFFLKKEKNAIEILRALL